jgi:hypothetical protein
MLTLRGAWLPGYQDLGQAQRPGHHDPGVPAARRRVRLPPAPRRHRGRPDLSGHHQVLGRLRCPARRRHWRHHPGIPVRPACRRGQGRQRHPRIPRAQAARPGNRVLPVLWPRPGRRLHPRRPGHCGARRVPGTVARGRHGVRRQWARRSARSGSRSRFGERQGADLREGRSDCHGARVSDCGDLG